MEELEQILRAHGLRYPAMEPTDAVKLIYQNEFGGGHLIRDEAACLQYLRREYAGVEHDSDASLYEDIGSGLVRVNLAAVKPEDLDRLGEAFIRSAAACRGDMERFLNKLDLLKALTAQGVFRFDSRTLDAYLAAYREAGYPAVSHSEAYRSAYRPAYRVVLSK